MCFHTPDILLHILLYMSFPPNPRLASSPLMAAECPERAASMLAVPSLLPQPRRPPWRPGPHLDREWLLSWCMCGLYWARMVIVSHCCPMMSRACCSVALRRFMPLN